MYHPKLIVPPHRWMLLSQGTGICFAYLPGSFPVTFGTSPSPPQGLAASASACHSSGPGKEKLWKLTSKLDLLSAQVDWRPGAKVCPVYNCLFGRFEGQHMSLYGATSTYHHNMLCRAPHLKKNASKRLTAGNHVLGVSRLPEICHVSMSDLSLKSDISFSKSPQALLEQHVQMCINDNQNKKMSRNLKIPKK